MASKVDGNFCIIIAISKVNGHTSCIYACKVDNDNSIVEENPFYLASKKRLRLWKNSEIRTEQVGLYDVIRYRFSNDKLVFDQKTEERMVSHLLPLDCLEVTSFELIYSKIVYRVFSQNDHLNA